MISFFDIEVELKSRKIVDIGAVNDSGKYFHVNDINKLRKFLRKSDFIAGHNIINHDIPIIEKSKNGFVIDKTKCIDTLFFSALLFPEEPYHSLVKDDKLKPEDSNNPLNDSKNSMVLFNEEVDEFNKLDTNLKSIYYTLLRDMSGFSGFFKYISFNDYVSKLSLKIHNTFYGKICENVEIENFIQNHPIELAYSLALITTKKVKSKFPSWIIKSYPMVEVIINSLRSTPCSSKCSYCQKELDSKVGLKEFFTYDAFRLFNNEPLQEMAVDSALAGKSIIVVFPTGGGKSITYQLPAFMVGKNSRALTVVISPLQSLMKDQVDNLEEKSLNMSATINGLLDSVERSKVVERVMNGEISLLYISPESLRSKTIEKLLLSRDISRFVIDEAHCFSTWGHDFRVDYLYVGKFIKMLQDKKGNGKQIPVSCFTATAKKDVVEDIENYFKDTLDLQMEKIISRSGRTNLSYKVIDVSDDETKYKEMRILIDQKDCPTIVYTSRTKTVEKLYSRLQSDGYFVSKFHGKMDKEDKVEEQNKFMIGNSRIMIATSAFGMGVDKKDVGMVIHYEISSSIENYIQEAGRAGRDSSILADCYILYNENDLDKHFRLLSQTKLNHKEIQQIWSGIKKISKTRKNITKSALEIAKSAGWDDSVRDMQTRVTTAIAALEDSGYLDRRQNSPRVFANSILVDNQMQAISKIESSTLIEEADKENAKRITKSLISSKYSKRGINDEAESRVDYLSDSLGIDIKEVMRILRLLREEKILADMKDLRCTIKKNAKINTSKNTLDKINILEQHLISLFQEETSHFNLKELNENAQSVNLKSNPENIRLIINYLDITNQINILRRAKSNITIETINSYEQLLEQSRRRYFVSSIIVEYLFNKSFDRSNDVEEVGAENEVSFSIIELKNHCNKQIGMIEKEVSSSEIEDSLFYLKKINALNIEGGFLVLYSPMNIVRIEDTSKRYLKEDYNKLGDFYKNKSQQIHIVGEYARKMMSDYQKALEFVNDYFIMEYSDFTQKYFRKRLDEINRNMSQSKFNEIFSELSVDQLAIVKDKEHDSIVVAAGPGSGKTRLLVHKLAAIFYTEDIRHEQLLMLTFSRSAVNEFKERILKMIGSQAHFFEIKTFHSFCFDLLGRVGNLEKSKEVVKEAIKLIKDGEVEESRITKMVVVIDEAQDMREEEYELIKILLEKNENVRLIAVGDDDQNIFSFRGSSNDYLVELQEKSKLYELPMNYRAKSNLVDFTNKFVATIRNRMKTIPIQSKTNELGHIRVVKHLGKNLINPVVSHIIKSGLSGKSCVLARTNTEANYIAGLLNKKGVKAQLIQDNSNFTLYNLSEIRVFLNHLLKDDDKPSISIQQWEDSIKHFDIKYKGTMNYDVCSKALQLFDKINGKFKYVSDLIEFLKTSEYDDYIESNSIIVSTLHKAKGREFDNVIIMYDKSYILDEDEKRLLYVGMTRAKTNLYIHYKGDFLNFDDIEDFDYYIDSKEYDKPEFLVFTLTHRDVNLGYFKYTQRNVSNVSPATILYLDEDYKFAHNNRRVLQLSKNYQDEFNKILEDGYALDEAMVRHKVLWYSADDETEYEIVLPQLVFRKINNEETNQDNNLRDAAEDSNVLKDTTIKKRKRIYEYISKNIENSVYIMIKGHKTLHDGKYQVQSVSDLYGGKLEGKNYFTAYVSNGESKVNVGCTCIDEAFVKMKV